MPAIGMCTRWSHIDFTRGRSPSPSAPITMMLSGVTEVVGPRVDLGRAGYLTPAGERLWIRIDRLVHHRLGGRILPKVLPVLEPSFGSIRAMIA